MAVYITWRGAGGHVVIWIGKNEELQNLTQLLWVNSVQIALQCLFDFISGDGVVVAPCKPAQLLDKVHEVAQAEEGHKVSWGAQFADGEVVA
eukprot:scaffold90121_cov30-Tisochrysis_lutea.AAC.11